MTFKTKIFSVAAVIVGFDAVMSALSRHFQFEYSVLAIASFLIYIAAGYWGAHSLSFAYGALLGAFAGLIDSTIGWFISRMIEPYTLYVIPSLGPVELVITIVVATAMACVCGLIGAGLCKVSGKTRSANT